MQTLKITCLALGMVVTGFSADAYVKSDSDLCEPIKGDVESVARFFEDVAFAAFFDDRAKLTLSKWLKPVRLEYVRNGTGKDSEISQHILAVIGAAIDIETSPTINLDFKLAELDSKKPKPNAWMVIVEDMNHYTQLGNELSEHPDGTYLKALGALVKQDLKNDRQSVEKGNGCFYSLDMAPSGEILQAFMMIPAFGIHSRTCAKRTMFRILGLTKSTPQPANSILSGDVESQLGRGFASEFDLLMLRIHYDSQIKPGMERDKAGTLIRRIIRKACPHLS